MFSTPETSVHVVDKNREISLFFQQKTRTVAIANRSRVSIRVTKITARAGGVVNPAENFLSSGLIAMQNLAVVSHSVCEPVGGSKNWGGGTVGMET